MNNGRTKTQSTQRDASWLARIGACMLALGAASTLGACGAEPSAESGDDAEIKDDGVTGGGDESGYPATGFLRLADNFWSLSSPFCTATLITPDIVLTAAHCTKSEVIGGHQIGFTFGKTDQTDYIKVTRFLANPLFAQPGDGNDVAVGFLEKEVHDVTPAQLGVAKVGFGYRSVGYGVVTPGSIKDIEEHKIDTTQARKSTEMYVDKVEGAVVDAHGINGGLCPGDSGGPLYVEATNTVVAVESGGWECNVGNNNVLSSVDGNSAFLNDVIEEHPGAAYGPGIYNVSWASLSNLVGGHCSNAGGAMGPDCASAYSRYCAASATSGFGPNGKSKEDVEITCVNGSVVQAHFSDWKSTVPSCDGSSGHVESSACWSAVNRYCTAMGFGAGFGPIEHSGDGLSLVCLLSTLASPVQTTYSTLRQFHQTCDGSGQRWGGDCSYAVAQYCRSIGAASGFGPVENSGDNVTIVCTY